MKKIETIPVECSGRHVHLCIEHVKALFGKDALTPVKELSQPGQYVCEERVDLIGPKATFTGVAVLWPPRPKTQVELSRTDAIALGVKPPVRMSGDLEGSVDILIRVGENEVEAKGSVIVAKRHIHIHPDDEAVLGIKNGDCVDLFIDGERPVILMNVDVRTDPMYRRAVHIDYDEGNAAGSGKETTATVWRNE